MKERPADLIVRGGRVWPSAGHGAAADALAVRDGRVLASGPWTDLSPLRGARTRVLDAAGATVTPGLVDAHLHLLAWARTTDQLDLQGAAGRDDVLRRVAAFAAARPGSATIVGRGWDDADWNEPPGRQALDAVVADRPVLLHSRDLHNLWVNGAALRAARITRETPDPPGGIVTREATGAPTGLLRENAVHLCAALEAGTPKSEEACLARAIGLLHAAGVTGVHTFEGADAQRTERRVTGGGRRLRVVAHLPVESLEATLEIGLESGTGDARFRIGAIKVFADGTLGSRTAALLDPYDGTDARGMDVLDPAALRALVARAFAGGLSVAVHAIGDRACRNALDAFEASRGRIGALAMPPRIEHVQLIHEDDLPRFAALGVAASVQPQFLTSDIELVERHWSSRRDRAYAWRSLLDHGALVAFGSDAPVEPPDAPLGIHAAVTRERPGRPGAFVPGQRVTLDEALMAYTLGPAKLAGTWPETGALTPGALADLVVWDADLHALAADALRAAKPRWTVIEGTVVWSSEGGATGGNPIAAAAGVTEAA